MSASAPELSIVIPSYNEELRLPATLKAIAAYLRSSSRDVEVIVVDDGSKDKTIAVGESFRSEIPSLRVISNGQNRGKGYSVRHGMQEAAGRNVLFTDADLSAPIDEVEKLLPAMKDHEVAIGSRAVDRSLISVHESLFREFAGIIFNKLVRIILRLPFGERRLARIVALRLRLLRERARKRLHRRRERRPRIRLSRRRHHDDEKQRDDR